MDIEKVKWMFALRACDSGICRARDFPHLPPNQNFLFRGGGGFFSFTLPKHFCVFPGTICYNETTVPRDLMQRDDGTERSVRWPWILLY
ncbi:uncharacterized protein G2W53_014757 [Senna tora]|uniref:Uncharacterized protein n=1 Tax=Senna tora TaxID=362788 RepID=A0A835C4M0_9FABA|nr:uncharacterized protein G2W53_014757 [Senna tora]